MKILIINLTRMGDLIQTIGLVNASQKRYPDSKIDILVMKGFSPIVKHFSNINEIITLNEEILNNNLANNFWEGFTELITVINKLNSVNYDILYNPIVSHQSSLLTFLINAKEKLGFQITKNREQKMTSDFIAYQLANQHKLGDYSFNLVDIFAGMVNKSWIGKAEVVFREKPVIPESRTIGFHIGASQSNKAWNTKYYYKVITELLKLNKYRIILFGGYKEIDYKPYFDTIKHNMFQNTIGDFKLDALIEVIGKIDLMVTNDTGPMHIAVALGKPIIDISLGPVSKWETSPYNDTSLIIQANLDCHPCDFNYKCPHWNCQQAITPEYVVECILAFVEKKQLPFSPKTKLFKTYFDEFGFQSVKPVHEEKIALKDYIFKIKRYIWSLYFTGKLFSQEITSKDEMIPTSSSLNEIKKFIQDLIDITTIIINNLENIKSNKKTLDKNQLFLLEVKKHKNLLFNKAEQFELIYDWFSFLTYKESEIDEYDLVMIVKKTIPLYETLKKKLTLLKDFS